MRGSLLALALAVAASGLPACKASLGDGDGQPIEDGDEATDTDDTTDGTIDAGVDAAAPDAAEPDAPIDAPMPRPCVGGQQTATTCFLKGTAAMTWVNAQAACAALYPNAQLAKITSDEDQATLPIVAAGIQSTWIGGTDQATEGTFVWADGTPMSYTKWSAGEPNDGGGGEDCTVTVSDRAYLWDDRPCNTAYQYICSYPLLP
jgi:hypothetical protein